MLNRANERFKKTLTSGSSAAEASAEPGQFDALLGDDEAVHHVLSSNSGIEHETESRTTTMEPGGDTRAHLLVTDRRVLVTLGDDEEPEIAFDVGEIERAKARDGLLSTKLEVATATDTLRIVPDDGTEVDVVADTIERLSRAWEDLGDALVGVEAAIEDLEARIEAGEDPDSALTRVRSRLSNAHHCATREELAPADAMEAEVAPVEARVGYLRVVTRLDRIEERVEAAESAGDEGDAPGDLADFETRLEAFLAADAAVEDAREVHEQVDLDDASALDDIPDPGDVADRLEHLAGRTDAVGESLLGTAAFCCTKARDTDDAADAADTWQAAKERYAAFIEADWDGHAGIDREGLRYQLAWVVGRRIDALRALAADCEARGDDAEEGEAHYEQAKAHLETARDIAAACPFESPVSVAADIDAVEEKLAHCEWEWGEA